MSGQKRGDIAAILEERIHRAVASGALSPGDRLPSTRKVAADLGADPRMVAAAYRHLSKMGMVTLSQRSGVFLAEGVLGRGTESDPSEQWVVDAIANGIFHGSPVSALSNRISAVAEGNKLRVVVIAFTIDQAIALARELHSDFGFETSYILADALRPEKPVPRSLKTADVLVTTERFRGLIEAIAKRMKKHSVVVNLRPDLILAEWVMLLQHPVYVVGMDARLLDMIKAYLRDVPGADNMIMLVAGHDDLTKIPADAPTYVTEAARLFLGKTNIPGRLIKSNRLLDKDSVLQLTKLIVGHQT